MCTSQSILEYFTILAFKGPIRDKDPMVKKPWSQFGYLTSQMGADIALVL
jgi:hypothetical protein